MLKQLFERIEALSEANIIIAIDGRCAAGKTTLAKELAERLEAGVVHMDDFFLPMELRTPERFRTPGGNVHYERFGEEVVPHLGSGEAFFYQQFDCSTMELGQAVFVPASRYVIVEGAYSCHPFLKDYMTLKVFFDVDSCVQEERIRRRNGQEKLVTFREKWIPLEEAYFSEFQIAENADIVLKNDNI